MVKDLKVLEMKVNDTSSAIYQQWGFVTKTPIFDNKKKRKHIHTLSFYIPLSLYLVIIFGLEFQSEPDECCLHSSINLFLNLNRKMLGYIRHSFGVALHYQRSVYVRCLPLPIPHTSDALRNG